jgi:hypothetical protein
MNKQAGCENVQNEMMMLCCGKNFEISCVRAKTEFENIEVEP